MAVNFLTSGWNDIERWMNFGAGTPGYTVAPGSLPELPIDTGLATVTPDSTVDNLRFGASNPLSVSKSMQGIGLFTAVMGGINQAFGAYYAAKSQQYQLKSQALSYQYQGDIAKINARSAEYDAQSVLESSKTQIGQYTMQAGQAKASAKTEMAGRGLVLGQGSTREVEASMDLVKDVNVLTMNSNAVRAAEADRTVAQNYRNQSLLDSVSSANAMRSADSVSPSGNMFGSLLNSASQIGTQWLAGKNRQIMEGVY